MHELFPFNYFYAQLSPKKMFAGRHTLTWSQMLLVLLFLLSLNLLAIPFYFQKQTTVELKNYLPQVTELLQIKSSNKWHTKLHLEMEVIHLPKKRSSLKSKIN